MVEIIIICKYLNKEIFIDDNKLTIKCNHCGGTNILNTISILKDEYEIDKITIPKCELLKRVIEND